jgi:hypothetical protein
MADEEQKTDGSFLSIILFTIVTVFYYIGGIKPTMSIDMVGDSKEANTAMSAYIKNKYFALSLYVLLVIVTQYGVNSFTLIMQCGGDVGRNMIAALFLTFIPWFLIFGSVIAVLVIFPGFKSAFSNVIGYFAVAGQANTILTTLLQNTNINNSIDNDSSVTSDEQKKELSSAAEAILKLCGNTGILINQISPDNFGEYWKLLHPLMKPEYQDEDSSKSLKEQLLNVVLMRDSIGEGLWYFYTALLLISIVQMKIITMGCKADAATMEANRQKYLDTQASYQEKQDALKNQTYVL